MSTEETKARQRAAVLCCIRMGKDLANTRHWIAMHTGLNDRNVRERIEELRNEGHLICNLQNGNGYYIAEDEEDIRRHVTQNMSRVRSLLRSLKPFMDALKESESEKIGQMTIFELMEEV